MRKTDQANDQVLDDGPLRRRGVNPIYVIKGTRQAAPPPTSSWWVGKSREELAAAVEARNREMANSHVWRSLERMR